MSRGPILLGSHRIMNHQIGNEKKTKSMNSKKEGNGKIM